MARSMQEKKSSHKRRVTDVVHDIVEAGGGMDGLTISGGEPFEQPGPLYALIRQVKERLSLDIMVYTGYTMEELVAKGALFTGILQEIDILVDGRFEEDRSNKKMWRGSDNQRLILLSKKAGKYEPYVEAEYGSRRPLLFDVSETREVKIIGIPERGFARRFEEECRQRRLAIMEA